MSQFTHNALIAYDQSDANSAARLSAKLQKAGVRLLTAEISPADDNLLNLQEALQNCRILIVLMSPGFFPACWEKLEKDTGIFRSSKDEERLFIPVLLQNCKVPDSIKRYKYIDGRASLEQATQQLINIITAKCNIIPEPSPVETISDEVKPAAVAKPAADDEKTLIGHHSQIWAVAVTFDGKQAFSASADKTIKLWDLSTSECLKTFCGHDACVRSLAVLPSDKQIVSGAEDSNLKLWDVATGECLQTFKGHARSIICLAVCPSARQMLSGSNDCTLRLWDLTTGECLTTYRGHSGGIWSLAITPNSRQGISGASDKTIKLWDLVSGNCLNTLSGHIKAVSSLAITPDGQQVLSGSHDTTMRLWEINSGKCLAVFEGHKEPILAIAISSDGQVAASASMEHIIKLWELKSGSCLQTLRGKKDFNCLAFNPNGSQLLAGADDNNLHIWRVCGITPAQPPVIPVIVETPVIAEEPRVRYATAKVVIVGESGVGKTSLGYRLAENKWEGNETGHGIKIWTLKLPPDPQIPDMEREVLLWDFSGQTEYRLVNQLFWDETTLALLVFDPSKPKPLQELSDWEKTLRLALKHTPKKILLASRTDLAQSNISSEQIQQFCTEQGYAGYIETSAKLGTGIEELKAALTEHIVWNQLPWVSTSGLYKGLTEVIVRLKEEGICLLRYAELRQQLQITLPKETFDENDLRNIVGLLSGKGLVKPLAFGDFVLLQPELLNSYAGAVIRTAYKNQGGLACIPEQDVLRGVFDLTNVKRLPKEDEEILLWALRQTLLDQSFCMREETPGGRQLVFPTLVNQQAPEIPNHPQPLVTYRFTGDLEKIYNTLVIRLCYSNSFEKKDLWKNAAEFLTIKGLTVGFKLEKISETSGKLEIFFEAGISDDTKVIFIKYIHEHLLKQALNIERDRFYICPKCNYPAIDREVINLRLQLGKKHLSCVFCDAKIPLFDLIEQKFTGTKYEKQVQELDRTAQSNLEKESLELVLAGQTYIIAREGGQICRLYTNPNNGIDGEIEFVDDEGKTTGKKIYLQLKSSDSYSASQQKDDQEIFTIKNDWYIEHWQNQPHPVYLIVRARDEKIRWMNISEYLQQRVNKKSKQIIFNGEIFNAYTLLSVREAINNPGEFK